MKKNQFTPFVLLKKPFVGYEYVAFQFLKHNGYAQRLCNQIHNFGSLRKKLQKYNYFWKQNQHEQNTKQSNLWEILTPILWKILPNCSTSSMPQSHPTQNHPTPHITPNNQP